MAKKKKTKTKDIIVVGSKTKETIKGLGLNTSGDFAEALSNKTHELISQAAARAQANGRKTVRPQDL
jgi:hypothetical protein